MRSSLRLGQSSVSVKLMWSWEWPHTPSGFTLAIGGRARPLFVPAVGAHHPHCLCEVAREGMANSCGLGSPPFLPLKWVAERGGASTPQQHWAGFFSPLLHFSLERRREEANPDQCYWAVFFAHLSNKRWHAGPGSSFSLLLGWEMERTGELSCLFKRCGKTWPQWCSDIRAWGWTCFASFVDVTIINV